MNNRQIKSGNNILIGYNLRELKRRTKLVKSVLKMIRKQGKPFSLVGKILGISRQSAWQIHKSNP